jgi:hypothetical protein
VSRASSVENGTNTGVARIIVPQISSFTLYHCAILAHVQEANFFYLKKLFAIRKWQMYIKGTYTSKNKAYLKKSIF